MSPPDRQPLNNARRRGPSEPPAVSQPDEPDQAVFDVLAGCQPSAAVAFEGGAIDQKRSVEVRFAVRAIAKLVAITVGVSEDKPEPPPPSARPDARAG